MKLRALYVAESITSRHLRTGLHAVFAESGITNRVVLMMRQFVTTVLRDTSNLQCI